MTSPGLENPWKWGYVFFSWRGKKKRKKKKNEEPWNYDTEQDTEKQKKKKKEKSRSDESKLRWQLRELELRQWWRKNIVETMMNPRQNSDNSSMNTKVNRDDDGVLLWIQKRLRIRTSGRIINNIGKYNVEEKYFYFLTIITDLDGVYFEQNVIWRAMYFNWFYFDQLNKKLADEETILDCCSLIKNLFLKWQLKK